MRIAALKFHVQRQVQHASAGIEARDPSDCAPTTSFFFVLGIQGAAAAAGIGTARPHDSVHCFSSFSAGRIAPFPLLRLHLQLRLAFSLAARAIFGLFFCATMVSAAPIPQAAPWESVPANEQLFAMITGANR